MKSAIFFFLISTPFYLSAQTTDAGNVKPIGSRQIQLKEIQKVETVSVKSDVRITIFGEYVVENFVIINSKLTRKEELNSLLGTVVKVQENSITGTHIDPFTFNIYEIEPQHKQDFFYRVFSDTSQTSADLPERFVVHKTDHENIYGIADLGNGKIALPYKGALLILTKK